MNSPAMVTPSMTNFGQPSLGNLAERQGKGYQNSLGPNISQVGFFMTFDHDNDKEKMWGWQGFWELMDSDRKDPAVGVPVFSKEYF